MMRSALLLKQVGAKLAWCAAAWAVMAGGALAQPGPAPAPAASQPVDGIAAVVDRDVITFRDLHLATEAARRDLAQQNIQPPPEGVLQRQVLQRLIRERLEDAEAARMGIRVTEEQIDQAIESIAQRNRISVEHMRNEIEGVGTSWQAYREVLRRDIMLDRMRQRAIDNTIVITDNEVDAFLREQAARREAGGQAPRAQAPAGGPPAMLTLGQILVRVPENSPPDTVAALRKRAEEILARLRAGEDFAALAAAASDGPEALQGGALGTRPADGWPDLFLDATASLGPGQVTDVLQSGNGFHIIKVLERSGGQPQAQAPAPAEGLGGPALQQPGGPMPVTQTHARHILVRTSAVLSDEQARTRLEQVRQRIVQGGESFADLARRYSNDASAPQGGDLGWLNPGETVPAFEQAMDALEPGAVSEPIQSPFGWHLIQVLERRTQDMADQFQRMQARQVLFERRAGPAFEEWLEQLRDRAYIDNRLERQDRLEQNL
ncbi:peptidylprolyl isomerase [Orrella sp. JC864]|uniref:peptidylprolyl isomerase n=1 Tax=Orrella sp. JC864 TaxID=3120298 RepID=UPI0012BD4748